MMLSQEIKTTILEPDSAPMISYGRRPQVQGNASWGYNGADQGGWSKNWQPISRKADSELTGVLTYLWARSYEQHRNNVLVSGLTDTLAQSVGELIPQSLAKDPAVRADLEAAWADWSQQSGSDGISSWADQCEALVGSACMGGDVGVIFEDRPELGGIIPLRLNLVDAYRIQTPMGGIGENDTVNFGVRTQRGIESGYYVAKDGSTTATDKDGYYYFDRVRGGRPNFLLFRRPDATRRPGQTRATPIVTTVLQKAKDLHDYSRSHLRSAGKRSKIVAVVKSADARAISGILLAIQQAKSPEEAAALKKSMEVNLVSTPDAATLNLPNWAEYTIPSTDTVDHSYPDYIRSELKLVVGPWGLPYEVGYDIWDEASYARARILTLRESKTARRWRDTLGRGPGRIAWQLMVSYLYANGTLKNLTPDLYAVRWHGAASDFTDLKTEVGAYSQARSGGLLSPQEIGRRTNTDPWAMEQERLEFAKRRKEWMAENNLTEEDLQFLNPSKNTTSVSETAPAPNPDDSPAEEDAEPAPAPTPKDKRK